MPPRSAPLRSREPARGGGIARKTRIKKVNRKRKLSAFARCYGSQERVAFVKSLPCCACGIRGLSENAHIKTDGMSRKAEAHFIVPLCGDSIGNIGCHGFLHEVGRESFEKFAKINLDDAAQRTQAAWQSHLRQTGRARSEDRNASE